jgi:hypothetical protein
MQYHEIMTGEPKLDASILQVENICPIYRSGGGGELSGYIHGKPIDQQRLAESIKQAVQRAVEHYREWAMGTYECAFIRKPCTHGGTSWINEEAAYARCISKSPRSGRKSTGRQHGGSGGGGKPKGNNARGQTFFPVLLAKDVRLRTCLERLIFHNIPYANHRRRLIRMGVKILTRA